MERLRGRERERVGEKIEEKIYSRRHRIFQRSPDLRSRVDFSARYRDPPRGFVPRVPDAQISRRPLSFQPSSRHVDMKRNHDDASILAKKPIRQEFSESGRNQKKSFRDLFSDQDVVEGGEWTEVKRRKLRQRPRYRSPIIKRSCFRCGLGGHIRRNCPKMTNMRCYGCSSTSHLVKDCTFIQRPEEEVVELTNVFDINDKVQSLNNFAIFRARGYVNEASLREALSKGVWGPNWQGKIIPIEKTSFLVGFVNEFRRDMAVLAGKIMFDGFAGTFYAWNEDRGATKVYRPVIVWITLVGLPLHFWGKEEITSIVAPFGKIHKFHENLFTKKKADVVRVMVEVEDISAVPKTVKCSYKSVADNKVRFYTVKLLPSESCLPVSQWTEGNYKTYEEMGGSGEGVEEEGWVFGTEGTWRGGAARNSGDAEVEEAERMQGDDMAAGEPAGEGEEEAQGEAFNAPVNTVNVGERLLVPEIVPNLPVTDEERVRRRKGRGICMEWAQGANEGVNEPDQVLSGSGSCDPLVAGGGLRNQQAEDGSEDADSKTGPVCNNPKPLRCD